MKRSDGVYCDRCHLVIAPKAPDHLSYGKTDYHAACYTYLRRHTEPGQRIQFDEFRAVLVILSTLFLLAWMSPDADAEEVYAQKEWKPGRVVRAIDMDGRCVSRPFVIVGETENDRDTDEPRVIGFHSDNIVYDREQRIVWERIPAERFAEDNAAVGHIRGRACRLR
jgi:hypothetical protein